MERFVKGQVVVADFPFSDIPESKRRPTLMLGSCGNKLIVCKISATDKRGILLISGDFEKGKLNKESYILPHMISTINSDKAKYALGKLKRKKYEEIVDCIKKLIE